MCVQSKVECQRMQSFKTSWILHPYNEWVIAIIHSLHEWKASYDDGNKKNERNWIYFLLYSFKDAHGGLDKCLHFLKQS